MLFRIELMPYSLQIKILGWSWWHYTDYRKRMSLDGVGDPEASKVVCFCDGADDILSPEGGV